MWTQVTVRFSFAYSFTSTFQVSVLLEHFPWSPCQPTGLIDSPPLAHIPQCLEAAVIHCTWEQYYSSSESFHSSDTGTAKPFTLALLLWRVAALDVKSYRPFHWSEFLCNSISNALFIFNPKSPLGYDIYQRGKVKANMWFLQHMWSQVSVLVASQGGGLFALFCIQEHTHGLDCVVSSSLTGENYGCGIAGIRTAISRRYISIEGNVCS